MFEWLCKKKNGELLCVEVDLKGITESIFLTDSRYDIIAGAKRLEHTPKELVGKNILAIILGFTELTLQEISDSSPIARNIKEIHTACSFGAGARILCETFDQRHR